MSDYAELKRMAEAAPEGPWFGPEYAPGTSYVFDVDLGTLLHYESIDTEQDACLRYVAAANPAAVLSLIAENEALSHWRDLALQFDNHRMAALGNLKRLVIDPQSRSCAELFLSEPPLAAHEVVAERDQLKADIGEWQDLAERRAQRMIALEAENEALREEIGTDDKIIAERDRLLSMFECPAHGQCVPYAMEQVEELRKDAERYRWLRDSAKSGDCLSAMSMGDLIGMYCDERIDAAMSKEKKD